jgi:hypothetical protein
MNRIERGKWLPKVALTGLLLVPAWAATHPGLSAQAPDQRTGGVAVQLLGDGGTLRGELVATMPEGIWIQTQDREFVLVPLGQVREARVQRHRWTGRRIIAWTGIAGGLTTVGMFAACRAYDGMDSGECSGFALGWGATWALVGAVSAALVSPAWEGVSPRNPDGLRPWARFPQGLPPGFPPGAEDEGAEPGTFIPEAPLAEGPSPPP